jgi:hypothetical protein
MPLRIAMTLILIAVLTAACDTVGTTPTPRTTVTVDFAEQPDDWTALFSNYDPARVDSFDLESDYSTGQAWLLVGTRSGFEARTQLYYTEVEANFY